MLTAVYSLNQVYGAEIWVVFAGGCAAVYLAVCCLFRRNRRKRGIGVALLGLLGAEFICDSVWASAFYPGGEYSNYGLGGSYMLLLAWPGLLFLAGLIVAAQNGKE